MEETEMASNPCSTCPMLERSMDDDHACDACAEYDYRPPSGSQCPECRSHAVTETVEKDDYGRETGNVDWACRACGHEWYYDACAEAERRYFSHFDC
jgi:hypothetical protein